ncbi:MAG: PspC domain-containing protein [Balneolaceae bacterium]|nr:PspC domain-containing protein [Balneolaceae bacterium]
MGARLSKSRTDKMIAGVCGGIAEYLGWDPDDCPYHLCCSYYFRLGKSGITLLYPGIGNARLTLLIL